jgi:hypothetical protein
MGNENVVCIPNGALFSYKEEQNHFVCRKMDGTGDHIKGNKPLRKTNITCFLSYVESRKGAIGEDEEDPEERGGDTFSQLHSLQEIRSIFPW